MPKLKFNNTAKFITLRDFLQKELLSQKYKKNDKFPSETQIAKTYGLNRETVNKSVSLLVREGFLYRIQGRGTFVSPGLPKKAVTLQCLCDARILPPPALAIIRRCQKEICLDINIDVQFHSNDSYEDYVLKCLRNNDAPDIFHVHEGMIPALAEKKYILKLDEFMEEDAEFNASLYFDKVIDAFRYKNGLYGLPSVFTTMALFYNKKLFDRANITYPDESWDWDTLLEAGKKLTIKKDDVVEQYGFLRPHDWNIISSLFFQNRVPWLNSNRDKCLMNAPAAQKIMQFLLDLVDRHNISPAYIPERPEDIFRHNKLAMMIGRYEVAKILDVSKDLHWGVTYLPKGKVRACSIPTQGYVIWSKTKNRQEAWRLLKFLTGSFVQKKTRSIGWGIPSIKEAARGLPKTKSFIDQLPFSQPCWPLSDIKLYRSVAEEIGFLFANLQTREQMCERITHKVNKFLKTKLIKTDK